MFELRKATAEIKKRCNLTEGCTMNRDGDLFDETIATFETKEEALKELRSYKTFVKPLTSAIGRYYEVEEYFICECEDDSLVDILAFSKMDYVRD